VKQGL